MTSRSWGGQEFCDNSTNTLVIKCVTMGKGSQKLSKIAVIYGRPQRRKCLKTRKVFQFILLSKNWFKSLIKILGLIFTLKQNKAEQRPKAQCTCWNKIKKVKKKRETCQKSVSESVQKKFDRVYRGFGRLYLSYPLVWLFSA